MFRFSRTGELAAFLYYLHVDGAVNFEDENLRNAYGWWLCVDAFFFCCSGLSRASMI